MILSKKDLTNIPVIALIAANLVPIYGVLFAGWDAFAIVLLYWFENIVIGFYNVLKMAFSKVGNPVEHIGKLFLIPFFMVHYGGFCAVHGFFILAMFQKKVDALSGPGSEPTLPCFFIFLELLYDVVREVLNMAPAALIYAFAGLFVSHGVSFVYNFLIKGEYARTNASNLMGSPYARIVIMHIAILAGGFASQAIGSPIFVLIILIALKTIIDIKLHQREHKKLKV